MPIYTKKGDKGQTSLGNGKRVLKNNVRVESYGTIDELNSVLGVIISEFGSKKYQKEFKIILDKIQTDLFCIGAYLANPVQANLIKNLSERVVYFENEIDEMTDKMPTLSNFIFPGGGKIGAMFHLVRTVARRSERTVITLSQKEHVTDDVIKYLNRLSDLFLTMSRFANYKEKKKENIWSREIKNK